MTVADYVAQTIVNLRVQHVFTVSGAGMLYLLEAIRKNPELEYICNHHEQACAMAAESYARFRDGIGVALVTFGPGVTNAITGVMGAWMDSVPLLVISGQCKISDTIGNSGLRQRGIQEINTIPLVQSFTKYATMVQSEKEIEYQLRTALKAAFEGRQGPVWLDIPMDVQNTLCPENIAPIFLDEIIDQEDKKQQPDENVYRQILENLQKSERPLLYLGNGVRLSGGSSVACKLVEHLKIPFVTSWNATDLIPNDHFLYVGRPGTYGQRGANFALQNCDFLLCIGSRLSIPQTGYDLDSFARAAFKIVVDIDKAELNKFNNKMDLTVHSDAKVFINGVLSRKIEYCSSQIALWLSKCRSWVKKYPTILPEYVNEANGINSYYFCNWLSIHSSSDAFFVTDMGTSFTGTYQSICIKDHQRIVTSSGLASMGYGIAAAVGAAFSTKQPMVICITGDGGIQMNIQELQTISYYKLPVKIFILNNQGYLTIRHTQRNILNGNLAGSSSETGVGCPDFEKLASAYGIEYYRYSHSSELPQNTPDWLLERVPTICEIIMPKEQPLVPKSGIKIDSNGKIYSPPLEDLYPYLDQKELEDNMIIPLIGDGK